MQEILDKITAHEQQATARAEELQAQSEELTGQLNELRQELQELHITHKTVTALADEPDPGQTTAPAPDLPEHPAYQQIMTVYADTDEPLRARDLCPALDLPLLPKNTEGIRSKLKRLVSRGFLDEIEPGLFHRPRR